VKLYADRKNSKGRYFGNSGNDKWNNRMSLFDPKSSEPIDSCIRNLVAPVKLHKNYKEIYFGNEILNSLKNMQTLTELYSSVIERCNTIQNEYDRKEILYAADKYFEISQHTIETIESHLAFLIYKSSSNLSVQEIAEELCINTLAYELSNQNEKTILIEIFTTLAINMSSYLDKRMLFLQSRAMIGSGKTVLILEWIEVNIAYLSDLNQNNLLYIKESLIKLFYNIYNYTVISFEQFGYLLEKWENGNTIYEITQAYNESFLENQTVFTIESICKRDISYSLSYLLGIIIDVAGDFEENSKQYLLEYQKRVKYGLPNLASVIIYEKGLTDRFIAYQISRIIEDYDIDEKRIVLSLKKSDNEILSFLQTVPSNFILAYKKIVLK
jgi:hypothetical protein